MSHGGQTNHIDPREFGQKLRDHRVAVWDPLARSFRPIPAALTPTVVDDKEWIKVQDDALIVAGAFPKLLAWLQRPENDQLFGAVFAGLTGIEYEAATADPWKNWGHASIRMDLFWHHGDIKIIEVNCTIPAMQSYSDQIRLAWDASGGLAESFTSNEDQLLESLIALYRTHGGRLARPSIIITHRPGDSQIGELLNLASNWRAKGLRVSLATPDELERQGDLWIRDGEPYEIIYRHIFAWRLPSVPWNALLQDSASHHIYNPVSAHYECKSFLALLSQVADSPDLALAAGLNGAETRTIQGRVPWSRLITSADQKDLTEIANRAQSLVFKRSVGYGGHQVIMGNTWNEHATQEKLRALTKSSAQVSPADFLNWIFRDDSSCWIAQDLMSGARRETEVLTKGIVEIWNAWYDASIFISTGSYATCGGGVSRIAQHQIVNIGTGGGLAPFVVESGRHP
jgi:hypothetical protein